MKRWFRLSTLFVTATVAVILVSAYVFMQCKNQPDMMMENNEECDFNIDCFYDEYYFL